MREHRATLRLKRLCAVLGVSKSGYYAWCDRPESARAKRQRTLMGKIRAVYAQSRQTYGAPRIHAELKAHGACVGRNTIARLMQKAGIVPKTIRKYRLTTDSRYTKAAPNLLAQDFKASRPNERWVSDMTFIPTREGWLYLAVILDLYARAVVGWAMADRLKQALALDALSMALKRRERPALLHSDQGCQYAGAAYQALLTQHGITCSMSRKGNCYDNAVTESFFHTLKTELIHHEDYRTREAARLSVFEYIEIFYNRQRRHSTLNYEAPLVYEATTGP